MKVKEAAEKGGIQEEANGVVPAAQLRPGQWRA